MYNRENLILEQYPFEVKQTTKGRGALICDTSEGLKILKEYRGSEGRADFLYHLLRFLAEHGQEQVDCIVRTRMRKPLPKMWMEPSILCVIGMKAESVIPRAGKIFCGQFDALQRYIIF